MSAPLKRSDLRRYQIILLNKIKSTESLILALDMGAGKTAISLTAMLDLLDDGEISKVLIVAPKLVATATWPDEIESWEHTRDLDWTLLRVEDDDPRIQKRRRDAAFVMRNLLGASDKVVAQQAGYSATDYKDALRRELADDDAEVHIINKEALPWLWDHFGKGKRWPYDMIVVDESSMFKNGKMRTETKQLTRFGVMAKARKFSKRTVQLTGTPAPKGLENLWGQALVADGGERLGASKHWFKQRYFQPHPSGYGHEPRAGSFNKIMGKLDDIMFSLDPKYYPDVPPMSIIKRMVDLPRKAQLEYETFAKTLISQMYEVEAVNRAVLVNKLLQFANGSMYQEDGNDVFIHDAKLDALEDIHDEANGEPVMVAYSYRFDLERIKKRFKKAVVFGEGDIRRTKAQWNAGDIGMLLVHPASVGHGQNLQYGGRISVWYGLNLDLEIYQQLNKRLWRPGQTRPVFNHHILARNTYDETVLPMLSNKAATQDSILRAVVLDM